jgi:hypothetical protein
LLGGDEMSEQYIRGFKEALEWILHKANTQATVEDLVKIVARKLESVNEKHMANIETL